MDISSIRKDYTLKSLDISDVNNSPFEQFHQWLREAISAEALEVNAMTLSTLHADGYPNGRVVLLKELDYGFVFFSNYQSEKGQELENHPKASLTFFWPELERQVRVMGTVEKISESQSDEYFLSRPKGSQIGAWASPQSHKIRSREVLEERLKEMQLRFEEEKLVRPPHWGGYRVLPHKIEFWQGRPSRLHDRILYEKNEAGAWTISRLAP
ncbi:MAG: pyridoxamine 5'-phosphate oxidase PdxH [Algoriphagus marincola HL-49]|uniref:Pyridoxine/pyridoxamine 5'-phosphate oxidase n=1 Tax=Algoriphagus marincola HL-49 TaxID=1305737 RepID=A0A0P7Y6Z2_9BACT|nr:MAG: pyridoxamine 5'-phosphate oxidase PdxH [Algoriphagus marincola HL-49]